jgi:glycerol-3-phosphate cytidylyltransferase
MTDPYFAESSTLEEISQYRKKNKNLKICIAASAWDLLHNGHILFLKEGKEKSDLMVVFLQTNPRVDRPEKNLPILSFEERRVMIEGCRYVDKIFVYTTEKELYDGLKALEADLRILGDDYIGKRFTGDDLPTPIFFHDRSCHGASTTKLRKRIYEAELAKIQNSQQKN